VTKVTATVIGLASASPDLTAVFSLASAHLVDLGSQILGSGPAEANASEFERGDEGVRVDADVRVVESR
jgi:hypothetical protein